MAPERRLLPLLAAAAVAAVACSLLSACAAAASTGTLGLRHHRPARQHNSTRHGGGGGGRSRAGGGGAGSPGTGMASCNLFLGSWVYDDTLPMYDTAGCPFVEPEFDCQKYGRPDKTYLKYRWRPASCELPRYARLFLLTIRELHPKQRIMLCSNQWRATVAGGIHAGSKGRTS